MASQIMSFSCFPLPFVLFGAGGVGDAGDRVVLR